MRVVAVIFSFTRNGRERGAQTARQTGQVTTRRLGRGLGQLGIFDGHHGAQYDGDLFGDDGLLVDDLLGVFNLPLVCRECGGAERCDRGTDLDTDTDGRLDETIVEDDVIRERNDRKDGAGLSRQWGEAEGDQCERRTGEDLKRLKNESKLRVRS